MDKVCAERPATELESIISDLREQANRSSALSNAIYDKIGILKFNDPDIENKSKSEAFNSDHLGQIKECLNILKIANDKNQTNIDKLNKLI